jgi:hypothetical protein
MSKLKNLIQIGSASVLVTCVTVTAALAGSSSTATGKNGWKINTLTTRTQSECNLYNPQCNLVCTRTYPITDHAVAVAKCAAVKC